MTKVETIICTVVAVMALLAITNLVTAVVARGYAEAARAERDANPSICQTMRADPDWRIGQAVAELQECMALMERRWLDRFGR